MLNEDKIKLMTELAFYEKKQRGRVHSVQKYFKQDYISKYMLLGFFRYTLGFLLLSLIYFVYILGDIKDGIHITDFIMNVEIYIIIYIVGLIIFEIIVWSVWSRRYDYARDVQGIYLSKLRRLQKRYEFQTKTKELSREES